MNLADIIGRWALRRSDRLAVDDGSRGWTWNELHADVRRAATGLAGLGVGEGDRVAILARNRGEILVNLFACARLGAIMVPLNWRLTPDEQAWSIADADCRVLVGEPSLIGPLLAAIDDHDHHSQAPSIVSLTEPDGPDLPSATAWDELAGEQASPARGSLASDLLIVYTSGTTGRPKGAVLTQGAVAANAVNAVHMHDLAASDIVLTALPLFHVGGLNIQTSPALLSGATVLLHSAFDSGAWLAAVAERRATLSLAVPTMIRAIVTHPAWATADLSSLRMLTTGSQIVPRDLIEAVHARGVPVVQVYGATETAPIALCQRADEAMSEVGSAGREATLCELRIVDATGADVADGVSGELWVRAPSLFRGYWRNPDATEAVMAGGWYRTGDVGHRRPRGDVVVSDRLKEVIITGGENVYPAEVEAAIAATGLVTDVAVVGREDRTWGEVPVAFVVAAAGVGPVNEARLAQAVRDRLGRFKQPRLVITVDELPRNAMGKVQKHVLRSRLETLP